MAPIFFEESAYLDVVQSSVKTQLADAPDSEVKEIVGCQAAVIPSQYSVGGVRDHSVCLPFDSEVIQSSRCSLMAKRLFGDVGVRLLIKLISRWIDFKLENMNCKAAAWP
ncbi:hypothetical protein OAA89_01970 [bacterium]|nr:hypothetical protein [bacterium]